VGSLKSPTSFDLVQSEGYLKEYFPLGSLYVFQSAVGSGVGDGISVDKGVGVGWA